MTSLDPIHVASNINGRPIMTCHCRGEKPACRRCSSCRWSMCALQCVEYHVGKRRTPPVAMIGSACKAARAVYSNFAGDCAVAPSTVAIRDGTESSSIPGSLHGLISINTKTNGLVIAEDLLLSMSAKPASRILSMSSVNLVSGFCGFAPVAVVGGPNKSKPKCAVSWFEGAVHIWERLPEASISRSGSKELPSLE